MVLLELPEVLFRGLLCPARTACMGGKGVGAEFHLPVLAHWRSPVPSLRFRGWRCVTVERSMGLENGRCQRPTRFTEVRCCVDSCNVSPNQQGLGPGRTVGSDCASYGMAGDSSEWRLVEEVEGVEVCTALRAYK
jgi:hypothetical protein